MGSITSTPISERPRERCLERGPQALSVRECLALIIGSGPRGTGCLGLAGRILTRPGNGLPPIEEERAFFSAMEVAPTSIVQEIPGLGDANQAKLLAAFELGKRYAHFRENRQQSRKSPKNCDLAGAALKNIPPHLRSEPREWLGFIPYYRTSEMGELCVVERGVRTHVNVDPAELFARVLSLRPAAMYLVHNHPSGDTSPSEQDFDLTRRVSATSRQFGIRVLGHWIVSAQAERLIGMDFP